MRGLLGDLRHPNDVTRRVGAVEGGGRGVERVAEDEDQGAGVEGRHFRGKQDGGGHAGEG